MSITVPVTGTPISSTTFGIAVANQLNNGQFIGDNSTATGVTLASAATFVASSASVTFTLTETRRVRIVGMIQFTMNGGTNGIYFAQSGYNSGSSAVIASVTRLAFASISSLATTSLKGSCNTDGTVVLAAGTYTAYMAVQRNSGGGATDTAQNGYVAVYDCGNH